MSAEPTDTKTADEQTTTWWEDVTDYWRRVWSLTWQTIWPPKEDH